MKFGYQSSVKESESEKKLVQKNPGCALAESSIWDGESAHVDSDLKNSAEEWAWVASELLNVNFGIWVDCCRFVVCGLWFVEEFQNLLPEFVCLGSWFWNLIILKCFKFSNF